MIPRILMTVSMLLRHIKTRFAIVTQILLFEDEFHTTTLLLNSLKISHRDRLGGIIY